MAIRKTPTSRLYGASGSSSESLVDLRIQGEATEDDGSIREPRFLVRNTDNAAYPGGIIEAPFTPNEWYDIEIIWDMSQTNQVTILINGEVLGGGAFASAVTIDPDCPDGRCLHPEGRRTGSVALWRQRYGHSVWFVLHR